MKFIRTTIVAGLCGLLLAPPLAGQDGASELKPVTRTYAFTKATVVTAPGQQQEEATVVVRDGLITAVGAEADVPPGAKVIAADSMFIYAGFIDGLSHTGVPRPKPDQERQRVDDPGNPTYEQAGITPDAQLRDRLEAGEKSVGDMRQLGFTAAQVAPYGRMLPGEAGLILLHGETASDLLYATPTGLFAQLEGARGAFPATVIGVMTKFRELYRQAEQAKAHSAAYRTNPAGMKRPAQDHVLEAFFPVIDQELPLVFLAEDVKTLHRVLALKEDLGFPVVLAGVKEGWHLKDQLAAADIPVYLSLDLPEAPKEEKKKAAAEGEEGESETMDPERQALEERRKAEMANYLGQAATLKEAGISFGFAMADVKAGDFKDNLRRLLEHGLNEDDLLTALTTAPARMMGLSASMGTVETGKMANLVVTDGPYFEEDSQVRYVMVDGHLEEFEVKAKKAAGDPDAAPAQVSGQWSYSIEGTGQAMEGTLNLVDDGGTISGTMSNPMTGQQGSIEDLTVSGNSLTFALPFDAGGSSVTVYFNLIVDGEYFEGTVDAGDYGSFPVEGSRIGDPE